VLDLEKLEYDFGASSRILPFLKDKKKTQMPNQPVISYF